MESVHQVPCLRKGIEACLADSIIHRDERARSGFRRTQQTAQVTRAWRRHDSARSVVSYFCANCVAQNLPLKNKNATNFFHLTPYRKIRRYPGPGSPLPLAPCFVWACTSRKDPGVDFTAILCGPRSLTKATLWYGYQLFC